MEEKFFTHGAANQENWNEEDRSPICVRIGSRG
jgi:hypothetical protein